MVAALAVAAGVALAPPVSVADGTRVQMVDNEPDLTNWHFDPAQLTVPAGSTVVWHNRGIEEHSVTADDKSFDSGYKKPGTDFQRAFPKPGKYAYHCAPHPWMKGVIQVVAASATTATTLPATTTTGTAAGAVTTTVPTTSATPAPVQRGASETTTTLAPGATRAPVPGASGASTAAPAAKRSHSRGGLAGTAALVLIPTLAALAIGVKLRRPRS